MQGRALTNYQFIMEFLFKVMKKTWLLPPDLTEAKNTCEKEKSPNGGRLLFKASLSHQRAHCYNLLLCVRDYMGFSMDFFLTTYILNLHKQTKVYLRKNINHFYRLKNVS